MSSIGLRIKNQRTLHKLTQKELGDKVGVTSVTVSKWELELTIPHSWKK